MTSKESKIAIIYTVFNASTRPYLSNFGLTTKTTPPLKIISFKKCSEGGILTQDVIESAAIILVADKPVFSRYNRRLKQVLARKEAAYLVVHKSDEDKKYKKKQIEDLALNAFKYPVLEQHSNKGDVFEFLLRLGLAYKEQNEVEFQQALTDFFQLFKMDIHLEAKLALLNNYNSAKECKDLLKKIKSNKVIFPFFRDFVWSKELISTIKTLSKIKDDTQFFQQKLEFGNQLFRENEE